MNHAESECITELCVQQIKETFRALQGMGTNITYSDLPEHIKEVFNDAFLRTINMTPNKARKILKGSNHHYTEN
jgi:hypothetical protein